MYLDSILGTGNLQFAKSEVAVCKWKDQTGGFEDVNKRATFPRLKSNRLKRITMDSLPKRFWQLPAS